MQDKQNVGQLDNKLANKMCRTRTVRIEIAGQTKCRTVRIEIAGQTKCRTVRKGTWMCRACYLKASTRVLILLTHV